MATRVLTAAALTLLPLAASAMAPKTWRELLPRAGPYLHHFREAERETGVPRRLMICLVARESDFDPRSVSDAGAVGLAQVVGGPFDPAANLVAGARELRSKVEGASGRIYLGLASYAMGRRGVSVSLLADGDVPRTVQSYTRWILRCAGYRHDEILRFPASKRDPR